jgi:hypothetical protein
MAKWQTVEGKMRMFKDVTVRDGPSELALAIQTNEQLFEVVRHFEGLNPGSLTRILNHCDDQRIRSEFDMAHALKDVGQVCELINFYADFAGGIEVYDAIIDHFAQGVKPTPLPW